MKRSTLIYTGVIAGSLLLVYVLFFGSRSGPAGADGAKGAQQGFVVRYPDGTIERITEMASIFQQEGTELSLKELMEEVRTGRIKLVRELWKFRRQCPKDMTFDQCDEHIIAWIRKNYSKKEADRLIGLLSKYQGYEKRMRNVDFSDMPGGASERFEMIKKIRREEMGESDAKLVFGYDEARADFGSEFSKFLENSAEMGAEERVAEFERMREEYYGDYWQTIQDKEEKFDVYNYELTVREDQLAGLEDDERSAKLFEVRAKYFGEDGAKRMAKVEQQLAQEKLLIAELQEKEAQLKANSPELSTEELAEKIYELRVSILGEEQAAAYTRRENYKQAQNQ